MLTKKTAVDGLIKLNAKSSVDIVERAKSSVPTQDRSFFDNKISQLKESSSDSLTKVKQEVTCEFLLDQEQRTGC